MVDSLLLNKKRMLSRKSALDERRKAHFSTWQKITQYIRPTRGMFLEGDSKESANLPTSLVNATPAVASRVLRSGMLAGASSPAYQWFSFGFDDSDMIQWGPAREAVEARRTILLKYLAESNFYQALEVLYGDAADYGNALAVIDSSQRDVFTTRNFAPGEFWWDLDENGDVDTVITGGYRTVFDLIRRFGKDRVSPFVRRCYDRGDYNTPVSVIQVIEPNLEIDPERATWKGKPFIKAVFEENITREGEQYFLEVSGYDEYPFMALRWELGAGNVWAIGPGTYALGDAAALQSYEFRDAQAVDKGVKPPLQGPEYLRNRTVSHAPGGITYYDPYIGNGAKLEPTYTMSPGLLQALDAKITAKEMRINEVYYKDLFLMLSQTDRREITAREVEEKHEEKLLALGPVLQRTHRDALSRGIVRCYKLLDAAGKFAPAPEEVRERLLTIAYTSALAYAQRSVGATTLERFFGFTGNIGAAFPQASSKIDIWQGIDYYADAIGVPSKIIIPTEDAKPAYESAQRAAQAQQSSEALPNIAQGAELLSRTDTSRPSALSFLLGQSGLAQ